MLTIVIEFRAWRPRHSKRLTMGYRHSPGCQETSSAAFMTSGRKIGPSYSISFHIMPFFFFFFVLPSR